MHGTVPRQKRPATGPSAGSRQRSLRSYGLARCCGQARSFGRCGTI